MKLKAIEIHNIENVPDHIVQDVHNAANEIGEAIYEICLKYPPNITLGALNWAHSAMTNHLVVNTDEAIEGAAKQQARALYHNIIHCHNTHKDKGEIDAN